MNARLELENGDVYAELRAENGPEFYVVVQVTPGGEERVRQYIASGPLQDIVQIETVQWTLADLQSQQAKLTDMAGALGLAMDSSIMDQHVIMYVTDAALVANSLRAAGLELPATIVVDEVPGLATAASHVDGDLLGGIGFIPDGGCTIGFAGKSLSEI